MKDRPYKTVIERGNHEVNDQKHAFMADRLTAMQPIHWLDIGCNSGWLLEDVPGGDGVDASIEMVERARAKGLTVHHGTAEQLPFESGSFDVAVLSSVLHLIPDWKAAIAEARRVASIVVGVCEYPGSPWGVIGGKHKSVKAVIDPLEFTTQGGNVERVNDWSYFFEIEGAPIEKSEHSQMERFDIDLGYRHYLQWVGWNPDRDLNPQHAGIPDVERYGAILYHFKPDGSECAGVVTFRGEVQQKIGPGHPSWTVESSEPLTLSPSVLCKAEGCGDHGFIRSGKWVPA